MENPEKVYCEIFLVLARFFKEEKRMLQAVKKTQDILKIARQSKI
jgi:hypothetical protein